MASLLGFLTSLDKPEYVETWIRFFAAFARMKKLKDQNATGGENEIMNLFLTSAGCEAIKKISIMVYPKILEDLTYEKI